MKLVSLLADVTPPDFTGITTAFAAQLAAATPVIITVMAGVLGIVFVVAISRFAIKRAKGSVS